MSPSGPTSEVCLCGSVHWHEQIRADIIWCRRCGCYRTVFSEVWNVPLDKIRDVPRPSDPAPNEQEEVPTMPGTPVAKKT